LAADSLEPGLTFNDMGTTQIDAVSPKIERILWELFFNEYENYFPEDVKFRLSRLRLLADLRYPDEWHPKARMTKRFEGQKLEINE
jgi:hypothetical protein